MKLPLPAGLPNLWARHDAQCRSIIHRNQYSRNLFRPLTDRERSTITARATLAANIRRRRDVRGLSQEELAEVADLSAVYLAALEQARVTANPTLRALVAIAVALKCELHDLTEPAVLERRSAGRPSRDVTKPRKRP